MRIQVLYFAAARERAGTDREALELADGADLHALSAQLVRSHPSLEPLLGRLRFAVNQEFVSGAHALADGDEVALIPPVAGGAGRFLVLDAPLRLQAVIDAVAASGKGGIVTFTGNVRDHSRGKRVLRLEYEAYAPMAEEQLARIGAEIEQRWPGTAIAMHHRVGVLGIGEAAVVIAAAAAHRKEAFLACEYAIERLKQDVPIWKKEFYEDGQEWVGLGP